MFTALAKQPILIIIIIIIIIRIVDDDDMIMMTTMRTMIMTMMVINTSYHFASCVVFFRAPQGRGKMRAMSKMSASVI